MHGVSRHSELLPTFQALLFVHALQSSYVVALFVIDRTIDGDGKNAFSGLGEP